MDSPTIIIILRIIYIVAGAFWVGGAIAAAFFVLPTIRATGPIGRQFAGALIRGTHFPEWLTAAGGVAVLAGLLLYWDLYAGIPWDGFEPQVVIGIGGLFAIMSLAIGFFVTRPTGDRMEAAGKVIQAQGTPPTPAQVAELDGFLARLTNLAIVNAVLVVVAAVCMAIGRYAAAL